MISRTLSLLFMLAAAGALGHDIYRSAQSSQLTSTALGKMWFDLDAGSLNLVQAVIERHIWPTLWDPALVTVLQWPAWVVFITIGIFFLLMSRMFTRRKRLV